VRWEIVPSTSSIFPARKGILALRPAHHRSLIGGSGLRLTVTIEDVLPSMAADVTVVHAERDVITSHGYAASLTADLGGNLVVVPGAAHSWPYADQERFAGLIESVLA
jgi:pimeloyl-ACP methyl ester carboxylesterase